jgi:uncharacterized protein YukE
MRGANVLAGLQRPRLEDERVAPPQVRISAGTEQAPRVSIEVQRERDLRVLYRLLGNMPLRFLGQFFERAHVDQILHEVFFFWEGFNAEVVALDFYVFDEELRSSIVALHQAWGRSLGHGEWFVATLNANIYRYRDRLPGEGVVEYEKEYRRYHEDVEAVETALDAFVGQIKTKFQEIDLHRSSIEAWQTMLEWHRRFDEDVGEPARHAAKRSRKPGAVRKSQAKKRIPVPRPSKSKGPLRSA